MQLNPARNHNIITKTYRPTVEWVRFEQLYVNIPLTHLSAGQERSRPLTTVQNYSRSWRPAFAIIGNSQWKLGRACVVYYFALGIKRYTKTSDFHQQILSKATKIYKADHIQ